MRFRHVLLVVGLPLVAIQRMPSVASMPQLDPSNSQLSSQFSSNTSGRDVQQTDFDPLGYDSGFWSTEYAARPAERDQNVDENPIAASTAMHSATALHSADRMSDATVYSDNLALIPIEVAVAIGPAEIQAAGEPDEFTATTQSDWDYAAMNAAGSTIAGSTQPGPSVTSAIVGFVGIVIVIGAYVSSGNRNP